MLVGVLHGLPPHRFLEALEQYHDAIEGCEYEGDTNSSHLGPLVLCLLHCVHLFTLLAQGIVWVINAAWQRATDVRELMLKELRMSFGVDLYKNLAIVLNFLPRTANKTGDREIKQRHKENWSNWKLCCQGFCIKKQAYCIYV